MINVNALESAKSTALVEPSDKLFEQLGKNSYDYKDLLSELIDNSIASKEEDTCIDIKIEIHLDKNGNKEYFIISDNGPGIPEDRLGEALSPAGIQKTDSLNEHGLGMKHGVYASVLGPPLCPPKRTSTLGSAALRRAAPPHCARPQTLA